MKWSLLELNKYKDDALQFNELLDVEASLLVRDKEILAVAPVKVSGVLSVNKTEYVMQFTLETVLTLPSTRSLTPVECPFAFDVTEVYMTPTQYEAQQEFIVEEDTVMVLDKDVIDLTEAVEDHLLLSIPLQVLTEDEKKSHETTKGNAWELMSEDAYMEKKVQQEENNIDPRLAKLSALLDNSKESDEE